MRTATMLAILLAAVALPAEPAGAAPVLVADLGAAAEGHVAFTLPPGAMLVGHATPGGGFALATAPLGAPRATTGLEPTYACTNDERGPYGVSRPLTASLLGAAVPNVASAGGCTGARGLAGPVVYLEFRTSGDAGGSVTLVESTGWAWFHVACAPSMTFVAAGAGEAWATTLLHEQARCTLDWYGRPPSEWTDWSGTVHNGNQALGVTHALAVVG